MRGPRDDLALSPGRITRLEGARAGGREPGEAWRLTPAPRRGSHYRELADVVDASADEPRRAPAPTDPPLQAYTRLGWPPLFGTSCCTSTPGTASTSRAPPRCGSAWWASPRGWSPASPPGWAHGDGRFDVRDRDAHDWIEVYFQGYGWVAFNPTPGAAAADVSPTLDLLHVPSARVPARGSPRHWTLGALVSPLALAVVMSARRRHRERAHTT